MRKRLLDASTTIAAIVRGNPVYALKDIGPVLFALPTLDEGNDVQGPNKMPPKERKDWFQSENERIKLETSLK